MATFATIHFPHPTPARDREGESEGEREGESIRQGVVRGGGGASDSCLSHSL